MYKLYKQLEKYKTCVIFGASAIGKVLFKEIHSFCKAESKNLYFADNSYKKWGNAEGYVCYKPSEMAEKYPDALWIVASDRYPQSMKKDLLELGVASENIVSDIPQSLLCRKENEEHLRRLTPQGIIGRIEFDVCRHCNLNCAGCTSFSPLVNEPVFADIKSFEKDMEQLSALLSANLGMLLLMGGEPLLHPEINAFSQTARNSFPDTTIKIVTNGILLERMPDDFWHCCKDNNIVIEVTKYPLKLDFEKMQELAKYHDVDFEFHGPAVEKSTWNIAFDCDGKQDPYKSFSDCYLSNYCVALGNGKLTTCALLTRIEIFNKFFNTSMKTCKDDFIDIYEAKSGREILEFLSQPVPFCRYCNVKKRSFDNEWHTSHRDINEWVIQ